jgi:hypothetical protein
MAAYSITAANVLAGASAQVGEGIAGTTITAGQPVYIDTADSNKIKISSSTGVAPVCTTVGLAQHGASAGQPIQYARKDNDFTPGFTVAAGDVVIVGVTGALHPVADMVSTWKPLVVGVGIGSNKIILNAIPGASLQGAVAKA